LRRHFGFQLSDESNIRLYPSLKGGALWDVACYTVILATMIAGGLPRRAHAATWDANRHGRNNSGDPRAGKPAQLLHEFN
jgi:hypothetical protein